MRLLFVARPEEYEANRLQFLDQLYKSFLGFDPIVAEYLEKALPPKEPELKWKVLQDLHKRSKAIYQDQMAALVLDIGKVLDGASGVRLKKAVDDVADPYTAWLAQFDVDELAKGAEHKYKRRLANPKPPPKWRYIYEASSTQTARSFEVGEKLSVKHGDKEGHFEVLEKLKDGKLRVRHDESGKETTVSEKFLFELYYQTHKDEISRQIADKVDKWREQYHRKDITSGYKQWLKKREAEIYRVFPSINAANSRAVTWGVRQEALGWVKSELHWAVDQFKQVKDQSSLYEWRETMTQVWIDTRKVLAAMAGQAYPIRRGTHPHWTEHIYYKENALDVIGKPVWTQLEFEARQVLNKPLQWVHKGFREDVIDPIVTSDKYVPITSGGIDWDKLQADAGKVAGGLKAQITRQIKGLEQGLLKVEAGENEWDKVGQEQDKPPAEVVSEAGYRIAIADREDHTDAQVKSAVDEVRRAVDEVRQAGFGAAVEGLDLRVSFAPLQKHDFEVGSLGGFYMPGGKREGVATGGIMVYARGFRGDTRILVHEIGHKYHYEQLSTQEQLAWQEEVDKRKVVPSVDDVKFIASALAPTRMAGGYFIDPDMGKHHEVISRTEAIKRIRSLGTDKAEAVAQWVEKVAAGPWSNKDTMGVGDFQSFLVEHLPGHPMITPFVSWYGGNNEGEYFAEAFQHYVRHGPAKLPAWTRAFFERITQGKRLKKAEGEEKEPAEPKTEEEKQEEMDYDAEGEPIFDDQGRTPSEAAEEEANPPPGEEPEEEEEGEEKSLRPVKWRGYRPDRDLLTKAGVYIGPRGGRWADPQHTIPWKAEGAEKLPTEQLEEDAHRAVKDDVVAAAHRAVGAGADSEKEGLQKGTPAAQVIAQERPITGPETQKSLSRDTSGGPKREPVYVISEAPGHVSIDAVNKVRSRDEVLYDKVKTALKRHGYTDKDFMPGGRLHGWSTNELRELLKTREK